jgi:hypothetical protein
MPGETDLAALLAGLDPVLHDDVLVWCTIQHDDPSAAGVPDDVPVFARIEEDEGVTLIVTAEIAERLGRAAEMPSRRIEMRVHSALEAVGMTAAMSTALAAAGISANVVAAFHHDHVLVPVADADRALAVLRALAAGSQGWTTVLDGDVGVALRVAAEQPYPDMPMVDVRLEVRGGVVSADIESVWWHEQLDDLVTALEAVAAGDLTERVVDGMRGPTIWFRSRGLVDGLWEVVVTASGSSLDSSAMIATSFERQECLDAAARVRAVRAQIS